MRAGERARVREGGRQIEKERRLGGERGRWGRDREEGSGKKRGRGKGGRESGEMQRCRGRESAHARTRE